MEAIKVQNTRSNTATTRDYGEGSVYLRTDGRWSGKYKDSSMSTPKYVYGKTEAEAKRKLREAKKQIARGIIQNQRVMMSEYVKCWLYTFKQSALEDGSFDRMEDTYNTHIQERFSQCQICSVTSTELQEFLNGTTESMSWSNAKKIKQILDECFTHAFTEGDISKNPMVNVNLPKKSRYKPVKDMVVLEDDECRALEAVADMENRQGNILYTHANVIIFMLHTGLRRGEMLGLQWNDIDFEKRTVSITKSLVQVKNRKAKAGELIYQWILKKPKSESGTRIIPLNSKAIKALMAHRSVCEWLGIDSEFIAVSKNNKPLSKNSFRDTINLMLKMAEIHKPTFSVHQLRHTFASRALCKKIAIAVVSKWLGHKDISTTYDTYIHLFEHEKEESIILLEAM